MDSPLAFAMLISGRMSELDFDSISLAAVVDVEPSEVDAWLDGSLLAADDQIPELARHLSLPRSLLREAKRRAGAGEPTPAPMPPPSVDQELSEDVPEPIRTEIVQTVTLHPVSDDEGGGWARDLLSTPWAVFRGRLDKHRREARAPTHQLSYVEDVEQRTTYQLRAIFTVGGVIALVLVLRWALAGFGASLAELWDTLTGSL